MSSTKTMLGFLAGAAVGALAGILFAPDKGSNTRKKIASKTGDITDSIKNSFGDFVDSVKSSYSNVKDEAQDLKEDATAKMNAARKEVKNALS